MKNPSPIYFKTILGPSRFAKSLIVVGALGLIFTMPTAAQNVDGTPLNGSINLTAGFLPDPHVVDVIPGGETAVADMGVGCSGYIYADGPDYELVLEGTATDGLGIFVSSEVDTTLVINDPNGNWHCNDDFADAGASNPGIRFEQAPAGTYDIWIGTYVNGVSVAGGKLVITEYGASEWVGLDLNTANTNATVSTIDFGDDLSTWANDGECDDPRFAGEGMAASTTTTELYHDATDGRSDYSAGLLSLIDAATSLVDFDGAGPIRGSLETKDATLNGYGFVDTYSFDGTAGAVAVIDLQSAEFDTFLQVHSPSGEIFTNDDFEGSFVRSLVSMNMTETGEYTIEVSSYDSGATGSYTLEMSNVAANATESLDTSGTLAAGDQTYSDGEYHDTFTFEGTPGQTVIINLSSTEFDTYLILESPNGQAEFNDDANNNNQSQIITQLSELGTYSVQVTSYSAAETGTYVLTLNRGNSPAFSNGSGRDSVSIALGASTSGALETNDQRSDEGKYSDTYVFNGNNGDSVVVDMSSSAFDTYLSLISPSGQAINNDDFDGSTARSVVEITLQETGRYRILATTYNSDATGSYALSFNQGSASSNVVLSSTNRNNGKIYGIFAGMADYPGEEDDLELTDQDALRTREALIEGAGMDPTNAFTLLNEDATNQNFRAALATIGSTIGQDDMLVIFYSGHGNRIERAGGPNTTDPDGFDETIELYDGALTDDELGLLLDGVNAGRVLLVFDSCFSGGFAKDVVSAPGRMGLFSSEEDVASQVAYKFQAGGYLAVFFDEAIRGHYADKDMNNELTALELSEYLHDRYRADVKSFGTDQYVSSGPGSSNQHLVVDRGGVGAYNVLFTH